MVFVVAVHKVLKDGTALKDADLLPIGPFIRDGGDTAIGVNL